MTEQEKLEQNLQRQTDAQNAKISVLTQEMRDFKDEMRDFKNEMRDRDNQRAAEIMELRQRQDAAQVKHDADIKELNARIESKFDKLSSQIQNMAIAAVVGIGAIVIGGGAIIWSAISSLK